MLEFLNLQCLCAANVPLQSIEAELAAIHWCLLKENFFCRGAPKILVMCDAKSMAAFLEQDLNKIENPRKQRMVERLMQQHGGQVRARKEDGSS